MRSLYKSPRKLYDSHGQVMPGFLEDIRPYNEKVQTPMGTLSKVTFFALVVGLILCVFSASSPGDEGRIELKFDDQFVSANIESVPLRLILEKIEAEKGLWYRMDESLSEKKVSVRFAGLPLPAALKRILSNIDYSLMFNSNDDLVGVFIFGKGAEHGYRPEGSSPPETVTTEPRSVREERKSRRLPTDDRTGETEVEADLGSEEDEEADEEAEKDEGDDENQAAHKE